jgi:hypothetical protein
VGHHNLFKVESPRHGTIADGLFEWLVLRIRVQPLPA